MFPVQISAMRLISIASVRTAAGEFILFILNYLWSDVKLVGVNQGCGSALI
jgi:hypothetical protein